MNPIDRAIVAASSLRLRGSHRRRLIVFELLAFVLSSAAVSQAVGQAPEPGSVAPPVRGAARIYCAEPVHDVGVIWVGEKLTHTFEIMSLGDVPLEIAKIKSSCGCAVADEYDQTIPIGKKGQIPVKVNTQNFHGSFSKSFTVESNDPQSPGFKLRITGTARPYVQVEPRRVNLGVVKEEESRAVTVKLTNNMDEPLSLTLTDKGKTPSATTELREVKPGQEYDLRINLSPPYERSYVQGYAQLEANTPGDSKLFVHYVGRIEPRLELAPYELAIPAPLSDATHLTLELRNHGATPVHVLGVEADFAGPQFTVKDLEGDVPGFEIGIDLPAGFDMESEAALIVVKTDDEKKPSLEVPVYVIRQTATTQPAETAAGLLGRQAPLTELNVVAGDPADAESLQGRVVVLDFLKHFRSFSAPQAAEVESVWQRYQEKGVRVVGVSLDSDAAQKKEDPQWWAEQRGRMGITFDLARDAEGKLANLFEVKHAPTLFIIGKTGLVEAVHVGERKDLAQTVSAQLDLLLADKTHADFPTTAPAVTEPAPEETRAASPRPAPPRADQMKRAIQGQGAPTPTLRRTGERPSRSPGLQARKPGGSRRPPPPPTTQPSRVPATQPGAPR